MNTRYTEVRLTYSVVLVFTVTCILYDEIRRVDTFTLLSVCCLINVTPCCLCTRQFNSVDVKVIWTKYSNIHPMLIVSNTFKTSYTSFFCSIKLYISTLIPYISSFHNAPSKIDKSIARRRLDLRRHMEPHVPGQQILPRVHSASVVQLRLDRTWRRHSSRDTGNTAGQDSETRNTE